MRGVVECCDSVLRWLPEAVVLLRWSCRSAGLRGGSLVQRCLLGRPSWRRLRHRVTAEAQRVAAEAPRDVARANRITAEALLIAMREAEGCYNVPCQEGELHAWFQDAQGVVCAGWAARGELSTWFPREYLVEQERLPRQFR